MPELAAVPRQRTAVHRRINAPPESGDYPIPFWHFRGHVAARPCVGRGATWIGRGRLGIMKRLISCVLALGMLAAIGGGGGGGAAAPQQRAGTPAEQGARTRRIPR